MHIKKTRFSKRAVVDFYGRLPFAIVSSKGIFHCDELNQPLEKIRELLMLEDTITILLIFKCSAGTIFNENGIRYFIHSRESGRHNIPHIHVEYRYEESATISLLNFNVLDGKISQKVYKKVLEKIKKEQLYLLEYWNLHTDGLRVELNCKIKD